MKKEISPNKKLDLDVKVNQKVVAQSMGQTALESISGIARKAWAWIGTRVDAHVERLVALRVYGQRRY